MPRHKGYRRKTRSVLTLEKPRGLSRLLESYNIGDRVVIDIDPSQHKGMPHRRYQGRVGIIKEMRRRSLVIDVQVGRTKTKTLMARFEHIKPLKERGKSNV